MVGTRIADFSKGVKGVYTEVGCKNASECERAGVDGIEGRVRKVAKPGESYDIPSDWDFNVSNAPKKESEEERKEGAEVKNG
jgi:hypothetical protein